MGEVMDARTGATRTTRIVFAPLIVGAVLIGLSSTGTAATDTRPPQLTTPAFARFTVGQQVSDNDYPAVNERLRWTASDSGSGLASVAVLLKYTQNTTDNYDLLYQGLGSQTAVTGYSRTETCTGFIGLGWEVRATDNAGNSRVRFVEGTPQVVDQNGISFFADEAYREFDVARKGTWGTSSFTGWYRDTTWRTIDPGARVSYTRTYIKGQHFALIMAKGPDRGSAAVLIDGVLDETVNTYSATRQHRMLVYEAWMPEGEHTVRVVNRATAGHPRIDIDAVMYNSGTSGC